MSDNANIARRETAVDNRSDVDAALDELNATLSQYSYTDTAVSSQPDALLNTAAAADGGGVESEKTSLRGSASRPSSSDSCHTSPPAGRLYSSSTPADDESASR